MFSLIKSRQPMLISCLTLDETFYKIKVATEALAPSTPKRPFKDYAGLFSQILDEIEKVRRIKIIQFRRKPAISARDVLSNIRNHNLKPRDAFHYSYMKDYSTNRIVTNDQDFVKIIPAIQTIPY
jgi:predicted nucleic acid-binding protein